MRPAGALVLTAALLSACAMTRAGPPAVSGYVPGPALRQTAQAASPAPAPGSPAEIEDRAVSDRLRSLEDSDRWWMAIAHAELRAPYAAQHFDCALGVRFNARARPALTRLMDRLLAES